MVDMRTRGPAFGILALVVLAVVALGSPMRARTRQPRTRRTAASPRPPRPSEPTPAGPTPTPSFVRPTPTPLPAFFVYTVVRGDTLTKIAKLNGTDGRSIAYWNRLAYPSLDPDSDSVQAGLRGRRLEAPA